MIKIWSLGDVVVDLLPLENMKYQACAGGAPANVAVGVARLGISSGFIGRVGSDPFGHFMLDSLLKESVDCQCVEHDETYLTSTVVVGLASHGERSFTFLVNPPADQFLVRQHIPSEQNDIFHFCSLALVGNVCRRSLTAIIKQIQEQQGIISFDINLRTQLWNDKYQMHEIIEKYCHQADVLKLSEEELFWLTESATGNWQHALDKLKSYPARLKIVTLGQEGCLVIHWDNVYRFRSYSVTSIDTTGAGDAYMSGLLAAIALKGMPQKLDELNEIVTQASACGALATTSKGAWPALPDRNQLHYFLSEHGKLSPVTR